MYISARLSKEKLKAELFERAAEGTRVRARARAESIELAGIDAELSDPPTTPSPESATSGGAESRIAPVLAAPEDLRAIVEEANQAAMTAMLEPVRAMSDRAFEYLVGSVLKAETVAITQKSRDGGFDGVLTFDSLGIRIAVFEAKRYGDGNVVGRPLVDAFATAARRRRGTHSLFVTSSRFSPEAIRLVDGVAFVELMAKHSFGLRRREQFTLYEIARAWSVDDEFGI